MIFKKITSLFLVLLFAVSAFAKAPKTPLQKDTIAVSDSTKQSETSNQIVRIDSLNNSPVGFPVIGFFNDTLFFIHTKSGSFTAAERAAAISDRIRSLGDKFITQKDSIYLNDVETSIDIVSGEKTLMNITDNEASWSNTTRQHLAVTYKNIISNAVAHYKAETDIYTIAKEIGAACLVLLLFTILIFCIRKLFLLSAAKIQRLENNLLTGFKIKNYTVLNSKKQVHVLLAINTCIKWVFIFISIYIALPILFGIFPWTQNFADKLFGYILTPLQKIAFGFWNYLPNLITILVLVTVFNYVSKILRLLKKEIELGTLQIPGFYPDWANPTYQIVRVLLFAFLIVVIFPYLPGSDSPIFQGVSVFLGFLFTFGSAGSLSNIIAGIVLTYMRLFKLGDRVKIGDVIGDVIEKSLLVTRIRTIKNEIISIPNSTIMNSHTINYSSDAPDNGLIIHTTVTIGYDVPWKDMHQALIDAALKTKSIQQEPKPFVLQTSLEDFYVSYQINAYTKEPNKQATIYSDLHQNIQDTCNERGIEIMSPHYKASRDGNTTTIPAQYLPPDYKAPGFNVNINNKPEN